MIRCCAIGGRYSAGSKYSYSGLSWAGNSVLQSANDSVNGNWSYSYDDFNRVSTSSQTGQGFSYNYDRFGNRWKQNVTAGSGPQPQYTFNNNLNRPDPSTNIYFDSAGNVINDGSHQYTYDAENRLTKIDGGSTATYVYDPAGRRVQQTTATGDYEYIFDLQGEPVSQLLAGTNSTVTAEWFAAGRHLATANGSVYFNHVDWLGTERARTDVSGNVVETCTSLSFGDAHSCTGTDWSRMHFTGQEHDSESDLEHFQFRQYSNVEGRWMHPDPAGMAAVDITNPQTWNRYAYVANNPVSFVDPMGLNRDAAGCEWNNESNTLDCGGGVVDEWETCTAFCDGGGIGGVGGGAEGTDGGNVVGTIRKQTKIRCAAAVANDLSLANQPSLPGPSKPNALDKAVGYGANAVFGNTINGVIDFFDTVRTATNAAPVYVSLATNGVRLGVPGGGVLSQGVAGVAQDTVLKGAFSNMGIYASKTVANVVGGAKFAYDSLTFLYGLYKCTY